MSTLDLYDQALRDFAKHFPRPMPKAPEPEAAHEAVNGICCMEDDDMHNVVPEDRPPPTTWRIGDNPINQTDEE